MSERKPSALYRHIEQLQDGASWGRLLDAGTGAGSLSWVAGLETEQWTAVTGSAVERDRALAAIGGTMRPQDQLLMGNWADPALLEGEAFDTVLADYLLGAIEGFAPYFQPYLFARFRPMTRKALYVTGLEPYVPADAPEDKGARLIWEIGRHRDACMLLSGRRAYREYPAQWVTDQLQGAGFAVRTLKHFRIKWGARFVAAQIDMCAAGLAQMADRTLAAALAQRGEALRAEAQAYLNAQGSLRGARNYVIAAEPR